MPTPMLKECMAVPENEVALVPVSVSALVPAPDPAASSVGAAFLESSLHAST